MVLIVVMYYILQNWSSRLTFCFFWSIKLLYFTYSHFTLFLLLAVIPVIRCHLLYHLISLVVTRCITRCHSLYHSMRCKTRCHSLYHLLSFVVTRCHSMSLDVPLDCLLRSLFHIFSLFTSFIIKTKTKKILILKFYSDNYLKIKE